MLVKEIKILLFYYQQSEFPCRPLLTKRAWPSSALPWASLSVPHVLIPVRTGVYMKKSVQIQYLHGGFKFADFSLLLDSL